VGQYPVEARLTVEDRTIYMARTHEHHAAKLGNMAEFFFSLYHGVPLLWEAVGEAPKEWSRGPKAIRPS
jgi:hypothetical protein